MTDPVQPTGSPPPPAEPTLERGAETPETPADSAPRAEPVSVLGRIGRLFHREAAQPGDAAHAPSPEAAAVAGTPVTDGSVPATAPVAAGPLHAPAAEPPIVEFRDVTKRFGEGSDAFTAIEHVTFSVANKPGKGEFISVLGPSGCGKSTILRLIAGLRPQFPATEGEVLIGGQPVTSPGADRGFVFQDYTSFPHRSVLDNVAFGLECEGMPRKERLDLAREWIGKVGLNVARDAHKYPHELSGGMRQRVAIARTLIMRPRIILMDEPFGALDPSTRLRMQDLLVQLWREAEATVFFITHSIEEAVYLGDRVYLMSPSPGTIVLQQEVPPPDFPARDMQRQPEFLAIVADLRDRIEVMEESTRAGT